MLLRQQPVLREFIAMKLVPFHYRLQCSPRKTTLNDSGADLDRDLVLRILRVELRRAVIVVQHVDDDSQKPADLRQVFLSFVCASNDQANPSGSAPGSAPPASIKRTVCAFLR